MTSLPASDPGSAAVWGSKRINPRPQSCLCLAWSGCPSNDDDDDDDDEFLNSVKVNKLTRPTVHISFLKKHVPNITAYRVFIGSIDRKKLKMLFLESYILRT